MPHLLRRVGTILLGVVVSVAAMVGICVVGVVSSMGESYTGAPPQARSQVWPAAVPVPAGRISVAVVIGATGSVASDVLAPYEVFARSDRFFVYTVAAHRAPAALSGGLHLLPDRTFDDVLVRPDVVVVPAVVDPSGGREEALRAWVTAQAARGSRILGVCSGSEVLAAAGLLDGRRATSFWSNIDSLRSAYPRVSWARGARYVEDGPITTTAGVTSGSLGALRLIEHLAGADEAARVGTALSYPGWSPGGSTEIPENRLALADLPYGLNGAFPWLRPTLGVGFVDAVSEIDVAAAVEVHSGVSFAARVVPIGAGPTVTTRHGVVLIVRPAGEATPQVDRFVVLGVARVGEVDPRITRWAAERKIEVELPGGGSDREFGFDPMLRDLAQHADRATALTTARWVEYPSAHLNLTGPAWPWRSSALFGAALLLSVCLGLVPTVAGRLIASRCKTSAPIDGRQVAQPRLTGAPAEYGWFTFEDAAKAVQWDPVSDGAPEPPSTMQFARGLSSAHSR